MKAKDFAILRSPLATPIPHPPKYKVLRAFSSHGLGWHLGWHEAGFFSHGLGGEGANGKGKSAGAVMRVFIRALVRVSTPSELAFLKQPHSSF